jgi:5,10-methylenetetrahydrofolate reductase
MEKLKETKTSVKKNVQIVISVPPKIRRQLKRTSEETGIPVSRILVKSFEKVYGEKNES